MHPEKNLYISFSQARYWEHT